ncbi:MAG: hypothetical protein LH473_08720 [Chitinophagales bacterium]|nr:hypothetical protein [Chitinophagales bacterium]
MPKESFGGKPFVSLDHKPMFAELAIKILFEKSGWSSRWIETYGRGNMNPIFLNEWEDKIFSSQIHDPIAYKKVNDLLFSIAKINGNSLSGCWDVLGWTDDQILFSESKRRKKDAMRSSQLKWLHSALLAGLSNDNFLIVEWDFKN